MVKPFIYWVSTYVFVEIQLWKSTSQLGTRLFTRLLCMSITYQKNPSLYHKLIKGELFVESEAVAANLLIYNLPSKKGNRVLFACLLNLVTTTAAKEPAATTAGIDMVALG